MMLWRRRPLGGGLWKEGVAGRRLGRVLVLVTVPARGAGYRVASGAVWRWAAASSRNGPSARGLLADAPSPLTRTDSGDGRG